MQCSFLLRFAGLSLVIAPLAAPAQEVLNGIAAVVNHDVVTFQDIRDLEDKKETEARRKFSGETLTAEVKKIRLAAIDEQIDRLLILQDFKARGLDIPEHFLDEDEQHVVQQEFHGDRDAFLQSLRSQGYTLEAFRDLERNKMIVQEMRKQAVKDVAGAPEEKIAAYYHDHADEFSQKEQVRLRMIVIKEIAGGSRQKLADDLREKAVGGANFGELASQFSEDGSKEKEGDWGWIDRTTLADELAKPAFALQTGETSPVIKMGDRYYLLHCDARKEARVKPLSEVHDQIAQTVLENERKQKGEAWLQTLRAKAYIRMF